MHIVLLNIRQGGGPRAQSLLDWLIESSPDVIVLPEWCDNFSGELIKSGLEATGFFTAISSRSKSNGILVVSRHAFQSRRLTPDGSEKGELLLAGLRSGCKLLAAYFPQGRAKAPFFKACIDLAKCTNAVPFLVLGDLNTGRNDTDVEGSGAPFACADLFEDLRSKARLVDLWRTEHGQQREWSWRSPVNGFRIDHALANMAFQESFFAICCSYDHRPREIGLTDHSALIVRCATTQQI